MAFLFSLQADHIGPHDGLQGTCLFFNAIKGVVLALASCF